MSHSIEAEVVRATDDLNRERWKFSLWDTPKAYLETYAVEERKTKRHQWRTKAAYKRQHYDRHAGCEIIREEPEVPQDVIDEGMEKLRGQLVFSRWRDRR